MGKKKRKKEKKGEGEGEGPAAEGSERHLQEKQEINAKAAGTAGGLVLL